VVYSFSEDDSFFSFDIYPSGKDVYPKEKVETGIFLVEIYGGSIHL
jgi:hypothetical protein